MANSKRRKRPARKSGRFPIFPILIFLALISFSSRDFIGSIFARSVEYSGWIDDIALPLIKDSTYYVENNAGRFSYMYSPKDKQSSWVAYMLTREDLNDKKVGRTDNFREDPYVVRKGWSSATKDDYYKSSFDRGHLLPSADRNEVKSENQQTFILSNISPQKSTLNRNGWANLEQQVRDWAVKYDTLYIVTGGVLADKRMGYIGKNRVTVPHRYFKVIMSVNDGKYNSIGFVLPNSTKVKDDFMQYSMSVNQVEKITKIDFFSNLPRKVERDMEKRFNASYWK